MAPRVPLERNPRNLTTESVHVEGPSPALESGTVVVHADSAVPFDPAPVVDEEGVLKGQVRSISLVIILRAEFKGVSCDLRRRRVSPPQERNRHV